MIGRRAYFLVSVNSDLNPEPYNASTAKITFARTDLFTVTLRSSGNESNIVRLFVNGNPNTFDAVEDPQVQLEVIPGSEVNLVGFSFVFTERLSALLSNETRMIIGAEVQVFYEGENNSTKRSTLESSSDKASYFTEVDVEKHDDDDDYTTIGSAYLILVNTILLFLVFML